MNESIVDNACDTVGKDTSTLSGQELPGQRAHDNDGINSVDKATDVNGDPSKDSDHTIDAENTTVDEPDCILDSVYVNTVGEANDTNGNPSQEFDVTVDAENSNIDGLDIIHDSSKTIDTNVEQTEPIVDSDVDCNDVSQKKLPVQSAHESEEVYTFDKVTDVNGYSSQDSDHTIDAKNMTVDEPDCICDSVEITTVGEEMMFMVFVVKKLVFNWIGRIAMLINLIFMTVSKPMMQMLSRQIQMLMMMLNKMMYPKILFKVYKTKLLIMMFGWKKQMRWKVVQ